MAASEVCDVTDQQGSRRALVGMQQRIDGERTALLIEPDPLGARLGGSYSTGEFEGIIYDLHEGLFGAWAAGKVLEALKPLRCY